jgi:hypothetical protein
VTCYGEGCKHPATRYFWAGITGETLQGTTATLEIKDMTFRVHLCEDHYAKVVRYGAKVVPDMNYKPEEFTLEMPALKGVSS